MHEYQPCRRMNQDYSGGGGVGGGPGFGGHSGGRHGGMGGARGHGGRHEPAAPFSAEFRVRLAGK
jgi:hypothetical protein